MLGSTIRTVVPTVNMIDAWALESPEDINCRLMDLGIPLLLPAIEAAQSGKICVPPDVRHIMPPVGQPGRT